MQDRADIAAMKAAHTDTADDHVPDAATHAALSDALRREAYDVTPGVAPIDAVLRQGRVRRRRRGTTAACAVVVAVALPLTIVAWPHTPLASPPTESAPASSPHPSPSATPTESEVRVLEPSESVEVAPGWRLGLLSEGPQRYVVAQDRAPGAIAEELHGTDVGSSGRRDDFSVNLGATKPFVSGVWRHTQPPRRMTLTTQSGREYVADLFTLPGDPGWGVYTFRDAGVGPQDTFTIAAHDSRGRVFRSHEHTPSHPPSPSDQPARSSPPGS